MTSVAGYIPFKVEADGFNPEARNLVQPVRCGVAVIRPLAGLRGFIAQWVCSPHHFPAVQQSVLVTVEWRAKEEEASRAGQIRQRVGDAVVTLPHPRPRKVRVG